MADFDFRAEALKLVVDNGYQSIVEVGVWKGELSKLFYGVASKLTLVDPWKVEWNHFMHAGFQYECTMGEPSKTQDELDEMCRNVGEAMPHATILRMSSEEASSLFERKSLDFVFIDAIHLCDYCRADISYWLPKIRPGGMLAGDDYVPSHNAVSKAVDELSHVRTLDRIWMKLV